MSAFGSMENAPQGSAVEPRVSVVLATHRLDEYLRVAIESILAQTFRDFELLLVVNEKLRDRRDEILTMCRGDARVRLLEAPALGGLALALNTGVAAARCEYIARMDGDDISLPTRLEEQVRFLDAHADVAVLGCRMRFIDEHGEAMSWTIPHFTTDREIRRQLPLRSPLGHPTLMYRRSAIYAVGGYYLGQGIEDWELYLRLAQVPGLKFHSLDRVLFEHRRHGEQATGHDKIRDNSTLTAGVLFTWFLRTGSPRFLLGILLRNSMLTALRRSLQRAKGRRH